MLDQLLYRRKRRDRWWRFLTLKSAYVRDERANASPSESSAGLIKAFRLFGYPVAAPLSAFWDELVSLGAERCPNLGDEGLVGIQLRAHDLSPELLPAMGWLDLFRLALGIGFFETARILRDKSLDRMIMDGEDARASLDQLTLACCAEVERGRFPQAFALLDRMAKRKCPSQRLVQARWYITLMEGSCKGADASKTWSSPGDPEFGEFIAGQRIALVGPVASESAQGQKIDSYDRVVKFGYRGGRQGRDPKTQGERIDIAYYNNTQAKALAEADYKAAFSELRWGVCHNRKGASQFPDSLSNLRLLTSLQWFLPDTHLNAGPNAVIDMLRFGPAEIRIFNTDMMLSSGRFAGYRQAGDKPTDYTRSFIKTHDPVLQYQVMHRLWDCGYIKGDARFDEVMAMGLSGYLGELQKAYGADHRALL